jgi:hypothetical protein
MQLLIDRARRDFTPITTFRTVHNLPSTFGITHFEPPADPLPAWGREAEAELADVQQSVSDSVPTQLPLWGWPLALPPLVTLFQNKLDAAGPVLGLDSQTTMLAVNTFNELVQRYLHAMIRARVIGQAFPAFADVYAEWLDSTVEIGGAVHPYLYHDEVWAVQVISHAYGKAGMIVWTAAATYYVQDSAQSCRLQPYLEVLFSEVGVRMAAAARRASTSAFSR